MQADLNYSHDDAGNITSIADTTPGQTPDTQCFRYDHLQRLTETWTPTTACAQDPDTAALGGPAPYWHSYQYDKSGNRLTETQHASSGDTTSTYTYPQPGQAQPHTLTQVSTTSPAGNRTNTYGYDQAGNTTTRTHAGEGETLRWDPEGRLASVTKAGETTSFIYDTSGARLLRKDPAGTTLYLGKQEIRLDTATGAKTATRYYTHGGSTVAVRQGAALSWMANDYQGSAQISINTQNMEVTRRRQLPFGGPRGTEPSACQENEVSSAAPRTPPPA
jgi:YD repeat-containing protein